MTKSAEVDLPAGVSLHRSFLDHAAQIVLLEHVRNCVANAPLFTPVMPGTGKPMRVRISNCGKLGWVTDRDRGYRYQADHPITGKPWPKMPDMLLKIWSQVSCYGYPPQACLINYYDDSAKMGLHQDRDEEDFAAPVVSISLGNECLFRLGQTTRGGPTISFQLRSGDVLVLGGESRLRYHGVDRIYPGSSSLLKGEGRINLTLRRVTRP